MTSFTARAEADAVVPAPRADIWAVLTDPGTLASLVPFLRTIEADGDHWLWSMTGLKVGGLDVAPRFTELLRFEEGRRIDFEHDPPAGSSERAGVVGRYLLEDVDGGTHLSTSMEITIELPLPAVAKRPVTATMRGVIGQMGDRFSANLLRHLGI